MKKLRIALVGTWNLHALEYGMEIKEDERLEVACVWDENRAGGQDVADQLAVPFEADLNRIWSDASIDGICLGNALPQREPALLAAARSGKHVFTEKVLTPTLDAARRIEKAIEEAGLVFTIAYPYCCLPEVQYIRRGIDSGHFGEISSLRIRVTHNGALDGWLPQRYLEPTENGLNSELGGSLMDLGAHPVYLAQYLLGDPEHLVTQTSRFTGNKLEDQAVCLARFSNQALAVIETGYVSAFHPFELCLYGTKNTAYVGFGRDGVWESVTGESPFKPNYQQVSLLPASLPRPIIQWADSIINETPPRFDIVSAVRLTQWIETGYMSQASGRCLPWSHTRSSHEE